MLLSTPEPDPVLALFAKLLGMELVPPPTDLPATQRNRITILLGRNYRYTPLQDLIKNMQSDEHTQGNTGDKGFPVSPASFVSPVSPSP